MKFLTTRTLVAAAVFAVGSVSPAWAGVAANTLPTGEKIAAGNATFSRNGSSLTVNQTSGKLVTNWQASTSAPAPPSTSYNRPRTPSR